MDVNQTKSTRRICVAILTACFVAHCNVASAQDELWGKCSRGSLLHWGAGFIGGPNLNEPLVTDRPDFTEASSTVGWKVTQIELGYTYVFDNDGTNQTIQHTYPEVLTRRGIFANWLELRFVNTFSTTIVDDDDTTGRDDNQVGLKIGLTPQQRYLPEIALIPQISIPTGSDETTTDEFLPGANLVYAWDLNDRFSLAGSSQVNQSVDGLGDKFNEFAQSVAVGVSLTDRLGGYAEWFALLPADGAVGNDDQHFFNGGFTFLISNDIQWDIRGGVGLNDEADEYFFGTGFSLRFR